MRVYKSAPTIERFHHSNAFFRIVVGPVGSGKSVGCIMEILLRAMAQEPDKDGVRKTRFAIVRNTYRELEDTTRKTFEQWIPQDGHFGRWDETSFTFLLQPPPLDDGTTVECEILFRALDKPEHIKKLLSLELTGAYFNEVREIPKAVIDTMSGRVGRYPAKVDGVGGVTWRGMWGDTNPWWVGHWGHKLFSKPPPEFTERVERHRFIRLRGHIEKLGPVDFELYRQPGGREADAENIENLDHGYYPRLCFGKDQEWIACYVDAKDALNAVGSVYGELLGKLDARKGIVPFEHPDTGIFTSWDLGKADNTSIWFWRLNEQGGLDFVDFYECHQQPLSHYFALLKRKPYRYVKHWLPHDARADILGSEVSVYEQAKAALGPSNVEIGPPLSLEDGIAAARWVLEQPSVRIHPRCDDALPGFNGGISSLREYRFKWDEVKQVFSRDPVHDAASHAADAFRYAACVVKVSKLLAPRTPIPPPPVVVKPHQPTLNDLFRDHDRAMKRRSRI